LRQALVAQVRESVDDRAEDHVQQQNVHEEELPHVLHEVPPENRVDVALLRDHVAHAAAVLQPEIKCLEEAEQHVVTRPVYLTVLLEIFQFLQFGLE